MNANTVAKNTKVSESSSYAWVGMPGIATKIVKNAKVSQGVNLDLRVTVSKHNVESYTWRASGEPAGSDWHKSQRAAVAARTAAK